MSFTMIHTSLSAYLCLIGDITKEKAVLISSFAFKIFINYVTRDTRLNHTNNDSWGARKNIASKPTVLCKHSTFQ